MSEEKITEEADEDFVIFEKPAAENIETRSSSSSAVINEVIKAPVVTSALDRINLTSGKFRFLMAAVGTVLKADSSKSKVSKSTIERSRKINRTVIARKIKQKFISKFASKACIVHWDRKLLADKTLNIGTVKRKVDRIAVALTSYGKSKVLGIPKVDKGTGDNIGGVVRRT